MKNDKKRILVTGGAGFVGSHLVDYLMNQGHTVTVLDNYYTGRPQNLRQWDGNPNFHLQKYDVTEAIIEIDVDQIYHLASAASPVHYMAEPIGTIKANIIGSLNMLELGRKKNARVLLTSTSEVYGDPMVHPQPENYWGNVNPIGPRACYDESKRLAETLFSTYNQLYNVSVCIARIFNTYGPRMALDDGRVVSNFIRQAINNEDVSIYGDGKQTRSFQYISDLVNGLVKLMNSEEIGPINIGNPDEYSIIDFAGIIIDKVKSNSRIVHEKAIENDPQQRRPDITKAISALNWKPKVSLDEGLKFTIDYFAKVIFEQTD